MNITWDANRYTSDFDFVHRYGEDVLTLVNAPEGSFAVDLGCGNGALTGKLRDMGYRVLGVDASADMLEKAGKLHPDLDFMLADAGAFLPGEKADVIFSNAVMHWIDAEKQRKTARHIADQLKPGGQFVCEFGGKGCAESVHRTLEACFLEGGLHYPRTFYFPTIGEYASILEQSGFRVEYAALFDRPTPQKGEDGLERWIRMFVKAPFEGMDRAVRDEIMKETTERLRGILYGGGQWIVDYVRIRIKAIRLQE